MALQNGLVYIPSNSDGTTYVAPIILDRRVEPVEERCTLPIGRKCKECGHDLAQEVVDGAPIQPYYTMAICTNLDCINSWG